MARPRSLPELSLLGGPGRYRKHSRDLSLATGLMMAAESAVQSPLTAITLSSTSETSLFYAYAIKISEASFVHYTLTFSSASTAQEWWTLVEHEYPSTSRESHQYFYFAESSSLEDIWPSAPFAHLRSRWVYASSLSPPVIPLQSPTGVPLPFSSPPQHFSTPSEAFPSTKATEPLDLPALNTTLPHLQNLLHDTTSQIHALSVAQSSGLQYMQSITESHASTTKSQTQNIGVLQKLVSDNAAQTTTLNKSMVELQALVIQNAKQTKSLNKNLAELQALIARNTSHNSARVQTQADELSHLRGILHENAAQIRALIHAFQGCGRADSLTGVHSVAEVPKAIEKADSARGVRPPPRKLERRVVGYEYEQLALGESALSSRASSTVTPERRKRM